MLEQITTIAREAGAIIMAHYEAAKTSGIEIIRKADNSPLTAADRDANERIVAGLEQLDPTIPIITEEAALPTYEQRADWTRFWLVDPLDGTKEFINQNGEFTVNIALLEDGIPTMGVVYAPAIDVLYFAARGQGAHRVRADGVPERIYSTDTSGDRALRIVTSRSHASDEADSLLPGREVAATVPTGSSLKFCLVADGTADVYPRKGPTMEWDVAAGDCVFRNSGRNGERSSPLRYNKPNLRNDGFVIGLDA